MKTRAIVIMLALLIPVAAFADLSFYAQDFEALPPVDGSLAGDGWLVFGNVFDLGGTYQYGYGPFPAPNNIGNWVDIVDGQGGPEQELQQIVVYSDYANVDHAGNLIESNVFQEQIIGATDVGLWTFTFDAKIGDLGGSSTALAFIKILDPSSGWSLTLFETLDMTSTAGTWTDYQITADVTGLAGQILQFGFSTTATSYEPCGVFYDNVAFSDNGTVATVEASFGSLKALYR